MAEADFHTAKKFIEAIFRILQNFDSVENVTIVTSQLLDQQTRFYGFTAANLKSAFQKVSKDVKKLLDSQKSRDSELVIQSLSNQIKALENTVDDQRKNLNKSHLKIKKLREEELHSLEQIRQQRRNDESKKGI